MKVELGKPYRDTVHGITGIATAQTEFLTGCTRVMIEWVKDGEIKEMWIDITRLSSPKGGRVVSPKAAAKDPGGPGAVAPSRDPVR